MTRRPGSRLHANGVLRRATSSLLVVLAAVLLTAPLAGAQVEDSDQVVRGAANASADSMSFLIINGGASLGWSFGRSTAAYRDITNTAEGKSIDLGALGALLSQPQCDGLFPPVLDLETLPPKTVAESFGSGPQGPFEADVSYPQLAGGANDPDVFGKQVAATTDSAAESSTVTEDQDFGFFRVEGARSVARTSFENGVRTAHAEFSADVIYMLGGMVTFLDPTWTATATSGAEDSESGGFSFRGASVFGNWVSGSVLERDLAIFETVFEGILGPLGVDIEFPEVTRPSAGDGIAVTPMSITMSNAPIGDQLLVPLLNSELLKQYRIDSVDEDCRRESFWTIIDAVERALDGAGSIDTLIGGAEATTDDTDYSFKPLDFDDGDPADVPAVAPLQAAPPLEDTGGFDNSGFEESFDDFDTGFDEGFDEGGFEDTFDDTGFDEGFDEGGFEETFDDASGFESGEEADFGDADSDDGEEISDSREVAAGGDDDGTAGDTAAIAVGVLALLGAIALSLGDRVMGMRNQHVIGDTDG